MANLRYKETHRRKQYSIKNQDYKIENQKNKKLIVNFVVFIIILLSLFNIFLFFYDLYSEKQPDSIMLSGEESIPSFLSMDDITLISMRVPAIDDKGNGLATSLIVEAMPGSGRTLVDIDNLLFWADTQQSIRTARRVAANITGLDINNYDLIYNIHANATVIGGESAGAAITIATIAALEKKQLNESVMITGTINHDGSIGPVSEIIAKARASNQIGATLFLVPLLQSRDVIYETSEHCEKFGPTRVCTVEQVPKKIVVSDQAGIQVQETGSVQDALKYFLI